MTTRTQILDCAEALFAARGFAATRTKDIAAEVGVNTAMIHYYFDTKEKLLVSVIDRIMADLASILAEIDFDALTWEERLEEFVGAYFEYVRGHPNFSRLTHMAGGIRNRALLEDQIAGFFGPLLQAGIAFIQAGIDAGCFRPLDPEQLVLSLYCATVSWFSDAQFLSLLVGHDITCEDIVTDRREHLIDLAFRAVGALRPPKESTP
ncbi:MAG: TetR/AcrR family transcriptional regulator [Pseudomonadota bacterium]